MLPIRKAITRTRVSTSLSATGRLVDGASAPRGDDRSGRALLSRLTDGIDWKVLSVNTHRPLFWFIGSADVTSMADLRGRRLAVRVWLSAPMSTTR
jgi:hypothetical protein